MAIKFVVLRFLNYCVREQIKLVICMHIIGRVKVLLLPNWHCIHLVNRIMWGVTNFGSDEFFLPERSLRMCQILLEDILDNCVIGEVLLSQKVVKMLEEVIISGCRKDKISIQMIYSIMTFIHFFIVIK